MTDRINAINEKIYILIETAKRVNETTDNIIPNDNNSGICTENYIITVIISVINSTGELYSYSEKRQLVEFFTNKNIAKDIWRTTLTLTDNFKRGEKTI